jgi:histidinol-phosphate aminotransferase
VALEPRQTAAGFEPYVWAATAEEIAARHGLSPADVLRFDANVPPFPPPLPVPAEEALAARAEYPEGSYRELRAAAAEYAGCVPEQVTVEAGADGLIMLVARTYLGPGRRALVRTPTYPLYAIASRIDGADVVGFGDADVVWFCNPDNPSGALRPADEIAALALALPRSIVAVDEAYYEYCGETVAGRAPNIVCIRTLSKAFGLAGLRVGYAISSAEVARELGARRAPAPVANAAARIAAAALQARPDVRETIAERERMRARFLAAGFDAPEVHANFVVVRTEDALERAADLERRGLVVRAYPDLLRITVRTPADDDRLLEALGV